MVISHGLQQEQRVCIPKSQPMLRRKMSQSVYVTDSICTHRSTRHTMLKFLLSYRYRMPSTQQFAYFFAFIGSGLVFMIIAFSVFLPLIVVAPSKFALSFTIGSILVMAGFAALRGLKQQASHMLSAQRLPFTAGMSHLCAAYSCSHSIQYIFHPANQLSMSCVLQLNHTHSYPL